MPLDNTQDLPSTPRYEYTLEAPNILLIRRLIGGTPVMHLAYKDYIAKYRAETPVSYGRRATSAKLYGGLNRVLSASVGMLFSKPPELVDRWSADLKEHWENLDGKGAIGDVFCKRTAEDAIADGFCGILVDFPPPPTDVVVHSGNEKALNLRPFWSRYQRSDILSWRTAKINNVETPVQVVLREGATAEDGKYGVKLRLLYRVCSLVWAKDPTRPEADATYIAVWELLEEKKSSSGNTVEIATVDKGVFRDKSGDTFSEIPLAICYAGRTDALFTAHPPLLDVAHANLEHWRVATNLRFYEDLCCFPQPVVEGDLASDTSPTGVQVPRPFQTGPAVLVQTKQGSSFKWAELAGTSLDQLRKSLEEKKQEIADLGMSFLSKHTRGVETAEAKRLDATAENSTLATAAQGIEDGINQALVFHARYLGIEAENAPTIKINRDFENLLMDATTMQAYASLVASGFPKLVAVEALQQGGRIAPDKDAQAIADEWDVGLLAEQDAKQDALNAA